VSHIKVKGVTLCYIRKRY